MLADPIHRYTHLLHIHFLAVHRALRSAGLLLRLVATDLEIPPRLFNGLQVLLDLCMCQL